VSNNPVYAEDSSCPHEGSLPSRNAAFTNSLEAWPYVAGNGKPKLIAAANYLERILQGSVPLGQWFLKHGGGEPLCVNPQARQSGKQRILSQSASLSRTDGHEVVWA